MKSIDRIDEQPTAVDQPLLRLRNVFQDRRSGKDRRMGVTHMDPAMDRRKGKRRKNSRRVTERRKEAADEGPRQDRKMTLFQCCRLFHM